jgi:hypothetical protein
MTPFARELGYDGDPFCWDEDRRALLRAELDAWYARAYGLTRDELRYVLDPADLMGADYPSETFRVLKSNEEREYGEYRTQRLVLDAWDRMDRGELSKPERYQRPAAAFAPIATVASSRPEVMNQPSLQFADADPE